MMDVIEKRLRARYTPSELLLILTSFEKAEETQADIKTYGYIPILLLGLFGNILIIAYFTKINKIRIERMSTYHFLIISLAAIDLVAALFRAMTSIAFNQNTITDQKILEKCFSLIREGSTSASCWMLVLLSYERYRSIVHPFNRRLRKRYVTYIGISLWVVCILAHVPIIFPQGDGNDAADEKSPLKSFENIIPELIAGLCIDCFLPSVLLALFYWKISKYLTKNDISRTMLSEPGATESMLSEPAVNTTTATTTTTTKSNEMKRRRNTNKSANETVQNLVILYVCLMWPGRILITVMFALIHHDFLLLFENAMLFNILLEMAYILIVLNSVVNIFVYAVMNKDFRSFLRRLSCGKKRIPSQASSS